MDKQLIIYNKEEDHKEYSFCGAETSGSGLRPEPKTSLYIPLHFWFENPPLIDIVLIQYHLPKILIPKEITIKYPQKYVSKRIKD